MTATNFTDPLFFASVGQSILQSAATALECAGLDVPDRYFVGFDRPPQDCCPELVAWVGNIRTWDGDFPDGHTSGRLLCFNAYSFDVTIRIGRCYVDMDDNGPLETDIIEDWANELYKDAQALYIGWLSQWRAGNVTELDICDLVTVGAMTQYREGGCAGHEFTITVGVM